MFKPTFVIDVSGACFELVAADAEVMIIRDVGPWDKHPTISNDAAGVVARVAPELRSRRLYYYDSMGRLDELLVRNGVFAGFAPGPRNQVLDLGSLGRSVGTVEPMPNEITDVWRKVGETVGFDVL